MYVHPVTGFKSVDHYKPKQSYPELAYEWSNYRFASGRMNGRKREFDDVLDPFEIEDGWFCLDFVFFTVKPNPFLDVNLQNKILQTIDRLKLNDTLCKKSRQNDWNEFLTLDSETGLIYLRKYSPFLAVEYLRQIKKEFIKD